MRPASPYRRHSAIALVFAAWCAAYGIPAEIAQHLTHPSTGAAQLTSAGPGKQAKVLLGRFSTKVRRAEQVRSAFLGVFLAPASACGYIPGSAALPAPPALRPTAPVYRPALFERPPPFSSSASM